MTHPNAAFSSLESELAEVEAALTAAADELGMPLGEVVHSRIRRSRPLLRAALILAIAGSAEEPGDLRSRRISLAGALEMLYVAMQVHRLLLGSSGDADASQDRTFMGGAILAGDYCFSRAAQMAARTDNPQVVRIFAQTLQTVSEGQLRQHFEVGRAAVFDENGALLAAGAAAAAALVGLTDADSRQAIVLGREIARRWNTTNTENVIDDVEVARLAARGQALQHWLSIQAAITVNGRATTRAGSAPIP